MALRCCVGRVRKERRGSSWSGLGAATVGAGLPLRLAAFAWRAVRLAPPLHISLVCAPSGWFGQMLSRHTARLKQRRRVRLHRSVVCPL